MNTSAVISLGVSQLCFRTKCPMNNRANAFYVCWRFYGSFWNNVRHRGPNIEEKKTTSFDNLLQKVPPEPHVEALAVSFKGLRSDGKPQHATKPRISPPRSPDVQSSAEWQDQKWHSWHYRESYPVCRMGYPLLVLYRNSPQSE